MNLLLLGRGSHWTPALRDMFWIVWKGLSRDPPSTVLSSPLSRALPPLTAAAKLRPNLAGTWRLLGEAAGLVVDLQDEVVGQLHVPGCLLTINGEGVVQVLKHNLAA